MYKWIPALVLLAGTVTPSIHAAIYKCVDHDGHTLFSQSRCDINAEAIPIRPEFKSTTNSPGPGLRKGETKTLKNINRREKERARKRKSQAKKAYTTSANKRSRCKTAKKEIRKLQDQRHNGCTSNKCEQIDEKIHDYRKQKSKYCY